MKQISEFTKSESKEFESKESDLRFSKLRESKIKNSQTWLFFAGIICLPWLMLACGSSKSAETPQYAATPTSMACLYGAATCDSSQYAQYYGFQAYPGFQTIYVNPEIANRYSVNSTSTYITENLTTFCNCPMGTRPVFNGLIGMGCVNIQMINSFSSQAYFWGQTTASQGSSYNYVNWNQVSNMNGNGVANGCYTDLAWACFIDVPTSCFQGYTCQPTISNSRLGICSKGH
jgi:hypothetical protein